MGEHRLLGMLQQRHLRDQAQASSLGRNHARCNGARSHRRREYRIGCEAEPETVRPRRPSKIRSRGSPR